MSDSQLKLIESLWRIFQQKKGCEPDLSVTVFASSYPEVEEQIVKLFPMLNELKDFAANPIPCPDKIAEYSVVRQIGIGGMGVVYEAESENIQQRVAIKIVEPSLISGRNIRQLEKEARLAATLHHSNIVPVFEFGEFEQNYFYTMKYIDGPNLSEVLHLERSDLGDELSTAEQHLIACAEKLACNWQLQIKLIRQIADAIRYAHKNNILHRDVKPANLLLDENFKVWITDFGLAKLRADEQRVTVKSKVMGTPRYMAPEQIRGEADERSDVFGLGMCFYEMALLRNDLDNGRKPIWKGGLQPPSHFNVLVPKPIEEVILKAVSLDPNQRQQDMDEFIAELDGIHLGHNTPIKSSQFEKRKTGSKFALATIATAMILVAALAFNFIRGLASHSSSNVESTVAHRSEPFVHFRELSVIEDSKLEIELNEKTIGFEPVSVQLVGPDREYFRIDDRRKVANVGQLDFDIARDTNLDNQYEIEIVDSQLNQSCRLTIRVVGKNEPPSFDERIFTGKNGSLVIHESNSRYPTKIEINDDELLASDNKLFAISGGSDSENFVLTPNGVITFSSDVSVAKPLDKDKDNIYEVELRVADRTNVNYARIEKLNGGLAIVVHELNDDATLSSNIIVENLKIPQDVIDFASDDGKTFFHLHRDGVGTAALFKTEIGNERQPKTQLLNQESGIPQNAIGFGSLGKSQYVFVSLDAKNRTVINRAILTSRNTFNIESANEDTNLPNDLTGFSCLDKNRYQFVKPSVSGLGRFFFAFIAGNRFVNMPLSSHEDLTNSTLGLAAWIDTEAGSLTTVRTILVEVVDR